MQSSAPRFMVRKNTLTDKSETYDVMFDDTELYNAVGFTDAYDTRDELRRVLEQHENARSHQRVDEKDPIRARLNMMSYHFPFDSPEARTCTEAVELIASLLEAS